MADEKLERVLEKVDPKRRSFIKQFVVGTAFAVPMVASYAVKDLALAQVPSEVTTVKSDRNAKEGFAPVDPQEILARVATLAIETWHYKGQDSAIRHIGPMAQDFAAAFRVGADDRHISTVDASGVALASIQALLQLVQAQQVRVQSVGQELSALQAEHRALHRL